MATQSFDNYTITNVTYQVTGGTNVYTSHQTAVLTISPNAGFTVTASDFSWINTSLANVNTVVFTQSGTDVVVTVTFDNPFTMPSAATTLGLCIAGAAKPSSIEICGTYIAEGSATNMTIVSGSPVPEEISYQSSGTSNEQVLLLDKTYTAASGYYFDNDFIIEYSGPNMVIDSYNIVETKAYDGSGNHTSSNFKIYYIFPAGSVYEDIVKIKIPQTKLIAVVQTKITNYTLDTSLLSSVGDGRIIRVFGVPNTTFTLASNNGSILSFETFNTAGTLLTYATTPTLTIPASGFFDINITIPASASVAQYCLTLAGGNLISPFPKPNPVCLDQYPDIDLTFNTTGTSNGQTFNVTGSPVVRSSIANFTPETGSIPYKNDINWTVVAANSASMSLVNNPTPSWTSFPDVITFNTSAVNNSTTIPVDSATGITAGMRVESNSITFQLATTGNPPACTVTNVSGNNITVSPAVTIPSATNSGLTNQQMLKFTSQKGSKVNLPTTASLDETSTIATVKVDPGVIERYGDGDVTYTLDLTSLLTIGSANQCKEFNVTVGTGGGILVYFDCVKNTKRQLVVFKGESDFSICALSSPAPTVTGTMSIAQSGDVCDFSGVDATCVTWTIVYNPLTPLAKSVDITYFDCVTLAENTITVGRGQTVTQCATRQTPISSDPGDGGATITLTNLTCSP